MNATIERRGYSTSELPVKEKPSTILKKIEIGTNYMKKYLAESMDGWVCGQTSWMHIFARVFIPSCFFYFYCFQLFFTITCSFLGREYEYLQTPKAADDNDSETDQSGNSVEDDDEADAADDASNAAEEEENADDEDAEANKEEEDEDDDDDQDQEDEDEEDDDSDSTGEQEQDKEPEGDGDAEDEDVDEAVSAPESENEKENAPSVFSGTPAAQPQSDGKNPVLTEDNTSTGIYFL